MARRSTNALTRIIWSKSKTLWLTTFTEFAEEGRGGLTVRCAATELWKRWKCNEKSKLKACDLLKDWKCLMPHIGGEPPLLESLVRTKVCKKLLIATLWPTSSSSQAWPRSRPTCFLKKIIEPATPHCTRVLLRYESSTLILYKELSSSIFQSCQSVRHR